MAMFIRNAVKTDQPSEDRLYSGRRASAGEFQTKFAKILKCGNRGGKQTNFPDQRDAAKGITADRAYHIDSPRILINNNERNIFIALLNI